MAAEQKVDSVLSSLPNDIEKGGWFCYAFWYTKLASKNGVLRNANYEILKFSAKFFKLLYTIAN